VLDPPHPLKAPVAARVTSARPSVRRELLRIALRARRLKASGISSRLAKAMPPRLGLIDAGCIIPMMVDDVEMDTVVLCGALLDAVKVRLVGEKPHEAEVGSVPQLKVSVPAKPLAGVSVRVAVPTDP